MPPQYPGTVTKPLTMKDLRPCIPTVYRILRDIRLIPHKNRTSPLRQGFLHTIKGIKYRQILLDHPYADDQPTFRIALCESLAAITSRFINNAPRDLSHGSIDTLWATLYPHLSATYVYHHPAPSLLLAAACRRGRGRRACAACGSGGGRAARQSHAARATRGPRDARLVVEHSAEDLLRRLAFRLRGGVVLDAERVLLEHGVGARNAACEAGRGRGSGGVRGAREHGRAQALAQPTGTHPGARYLCAPGGMRQLEKRDQRSAAAAAAG